MVLLRREAADWLAGWCSVVSAPPGSDSQVSRQYASVVSARDSRCTYSSLLCRANAAICRRPKQAVRVRPGPAQRPQVTPSAPVPLNLTRPNLEPQLHLDRHGQEPAPTRSSSTAHPLLSLFPWIPSWALPFSHPDLPKSIHSSSPSLG